MWGGLGWGGSKQEKAIFHRSVFSFESLKLELLSRMSKENKSIEPQPKCPVNFGTLAANVQAGVENRKKRKQIRLSTLQKRMHVLSLFSRATVTPLLNQAQ